MIFTNDFRLIPSDFWMFHYFDDLFHDAMDKHLPIYKLVSLMEKILKRNVQLLPFLIPYNIEDHFFCSAWRRPENYLDEIFRKGISSFANAPRSIVDSSVERLKADLSSGKWEKRYGEMLNLLQYDCGYRFLVAE
ncbi:hypothetical protein [Longirhabdus pacifica]|uniref:hypothetical protein n=1 Tax=Longirhabdus pacifica TaxID=2305227 RepID=UPI001F0BD083|nr:hypothetical protein [Longirhabdus pacifica]